MVTAYNKDEDCPKVQKKQLTNRLQSNSKYHFTNQYKLRRVTFDGFKCTQFTARLFV